VVNRHDYWIAPDLHLETVRARMFEAGARILQDAPSDVFKDVLGKGLVLADIGSVNDQFVGSEEAIEFKAGPVDPSVFSPPLGLHQGGIIVRPDHPGKCRCGIF
jgi:hypothetical protein